MPFRQIDFLCKVRGREKAGFVEMAAGFKKAVDFMPACL